MEKSPIKSGFFREISFCISFMSRVGEKDGFSENRWGEVNYRKTSVQNSPINSSGETAVISENIKSGLLRVTI